MNLKKIKNVVRRFINGKNLQLEADLTQLRDVRVKKAVKEFFILLGDEANVGNLMNNIGDHGVTREGLLEYYGYLYLKFLEILKRKGIYEELLIKDISYMFRLVFQGIELFKDLYETKINNDYDKATNYLFGVEDVDLQLTIERIDKINKDRTLKSMYKRIK